MSRSIAKPALAVSLLAVCTSGVFAETLGDPPNIDGGSYNCPPASGDSYTFYEPAGSNYSCSDAGLPGVLETALAGDSADPSGYVKLLPFIAAGPPTGPICIDGTFPTTGDMLEICSPALSEWDALVNGGPETLAEQYFADFFDNNPGLYDVVAEQYEGCLNETDEQVIADAIFADFEAALPLYSNPAITYIDQAANGAVSIGLAQAFDATPAYAQALKFAFTGKTCATGFSLDVSVLQEFQLQFTEVVKITFNDEEPFFAYSFEGGQTGRFQDDTSCDANLFLYLEINGFPQLTDEEEEAIKQEICSGSGNYEIGFNEPPPPGPPEPIPAVSGMGLALSALGLAVLGWRSAGRRPQR